MDKTSISLKYQSAENFMRGAMTDNLVFNDNLRPYWISGTEKFWYVRSIAGSDNAIYHQIRLVDADSGRNVIAFDHEIFAKKLGEKISQDISYCGLRFSNGDDTRDLVRHVKISIDPLALTFYSCGKNWRYDSLSEELMEIKQKNFHEMLSHNGKMSIYEKNYNVWVKCTESGFKRQLTKDGSLKNKYLPFLPGRREFSLDGCWSPDSKWYLTYRLDSVIDDGLSKIKFYAIEVESGKVVAADYPCMFDSYFPARGQFFLRGLSWWSRNSCKAYFFDIDRYHKNAKLVEFDVSNGCTKVVFTERSVTRLKLSQEREERPVIASIPDANQFIWYSERTGWGHLYLYDIKNGGLINQITEGEWLVRDIVHCDFERRELFLQTSGRVSGRDCYYRDLIRVNIDNGKITEILSGNFDVDGFSPQNLYTYEQGGLHCKGVSDSGDYAVVTQSRVDTIPRSSLYSRDGEKICDLECADISRLPSGWRPPQPVKTISADGLTEIYGVVYWPSDFCSSKKYPIIDFVWNMPGATAVPKSAFNYHDSWSFFPAVALSELGFIVVQFDGRGTPRRSKAFQDASYGRLESASALEDHVAGIESLAMRYKNLDLDRVGIVSILSGMGAIKGMLEYPDFYKVGVQAGYFDDTHTMDRTLVDPFNGPDSLSQEVWKNCERLDGKLMIAMSPKMSNDNTMHQFFSMLDAFNEKNKKVDILYDGRCAWGCTEYQIVGIWNYLVSNLLKIDPPKNFNLTGTLMWNPDLWEALTIAFYSETA